MGWLQSLATEFGITIADPTVWPSIGEGLLFGAVCLVFGVWVARLVGLLDSDAPAGETLGVGLSSGLLVLASWWAAVASGGRSSFTPVAVGFAIAVGLAVLRRRSAVDRAAVATESSESVAEADVPRSVGRWHLIAAVLGGAAFIVAVALLYGSTLTLSPRDGVQPLEFVDEAYYSILGADLARTGTETIYSPSGFAVVDDLPVQTWYHWGELWLASAVITIFGAAPVAARHFVVLPMLLLACAAMTGTMVRRITGSTSSGAYLFGFFACLFLAPIPVIQAGHFSSWAVGLIFGITMYGLASVAVLLAMYGLTVLKGRAATWPVAVFAGSAATLILPAHVVVAAVAFVGISSIWVVRIVRSLLAGGRLPLVPTIWRRTFIATCVWIVGTVAWGFFTGHGAVSSAPSPDVSPFNESWRDALVTAVLGSGAFVAIAIAWFVARKDTGHETDLYLGTSLMLVTGAVVWGARLADFNSFHFFYGGLATCGTPVAAVAVWSIWQRLRAISYRRLAVAFLVLVVVQIEVGVVLGVARLQEFGPGALPPVSTDILMAIRDLPSNAKLAYACRPTQEQAFWAPWLLSLQAHTGRPVVPMCFEAEFFAKLLGAPPSADVPSPQFRFAPQQTLYPDSQARPSPAQITSFLKANGIDYIYADAVYPNSLVPDAISIATSGETQVFRIP